MDLVALVERPAVEIHGLVSSRQLPAGLAGLRLSEGQRVWKCLCGGWWSVSADRPLEPYEAHRAAP